MRLLVMMIVLLIFIVQPVKDPLLVFIVETYAVVFHDHLDSVLFNLLIDDATLDIDI